MFKNKANLYKFMYKFLLVYYTYKLINIPLTWDKNIEIVNTPNQLCKLYKFGIEGIL
jgi:hypothetical protein